MKIGIMSFAHTHAASYVRLLREEPDIELRAADPGPHPAASQPAASHPAASHSPGEVRGAELARQLDVAYCDDYDQLMAWGPDAVLVTSENARHRPLVELAASRGAHILCEKPLATTWADGQAIAQAARTAGVTLMMAFPVRFASVFARLRAQYDAGLLGDIVSIRGTNNGKLPAERAWFADPELAGGGAFADHVVHIADLIEALTGAEPLTVTAVSNRGDGERLGPGQRLDQVRDVHHVVGERAARPAPDRRTGRLAGQLPLLVPRMLTMSPTGPRLLGPQPGEHAGETYREGHHQRHARGGRGLGRWPPVPRWWPAASRTGCAPRGWPPARPAAGAGRSRWWPARRPGPTPSAGRSRRSRPRRAAGPARRRGPRRASAKRRIAKRRVAKRRDAAQGRPPAARHPAPRAAGGRRRAVGVRERHDAIFMALGHGPSLGGRAPGLLGDPDGRRAVGRGHPGRRAVRDSAEESARPGSTGLRRVGPRHRLAAKRPDPRAGPGACRGPDGHEALLGARSYSSVPPSRPQSTPW